MDNDSGWAARAITLAAPDPATGTEAEITLPCRWVELVQAWEGAEDAYFLVSGIAPDPLPAKPWHLLRFQDAAGESHHFSIGAVSRQGLGLKVMRRKRATD